MELTYTPQIERAVLLREGTSDAQVWADTFTGLYHLPARGMPEPKTVLDLGANIGLTAAHYRYLWPKAKIVAVELDDENARLARRNAPGVAVRHEAVGSTSGQDSYDRGAQEFAYRLGEGRQTVMRRSLRSIIMREFGSGGVDFVKMDVEGEEWNLLAEKNWADLVRHLVVELHDEAAAATSVTRALNLLRWAGFTARKHTPHPVAVWAWR